MFPLSARLLALALSLACLLSGCTAPAASRPEDSSGSASQGEPGPAADSGSAPSQPQEPPAPPVPQPQLTQTDVDEALADVMEDFSAVAVSVAAIENGQLSQSGAWGWAIRDEREMTADTKLRVASLSKVAVGMCAMAMAQEGILDLDAPLSAYWGESVQNPYTQAQPTARTLMSHSSSVKSLEISRGLSHLTSLLSRGSSWRSVEPGDVGGWYYSNFGVCVLGTTLELASGQVLDDYFQSHFCQPMGLTASFFGGNLEEESLATLYNPSSVGRTAAAQAGESVPDQIGDGASWYPGGLTISAVDLAKLVAVLANGGEYEGVSYLEPGTVAEMETPQFQVDPGETSVFDQCLILRRQENILGRDQIYYHTGSAYGVFSLLTFDPDTGDGVVVLTTGTPRQADEHGLYALCSQLSADLYARMEEEDA